MAAPFAPRAGRCKLPTFGHESRPAKMRAGGPVGRRREAPVCEMKSYYDIAGDGGSRILDQVAGQRARIADGLAGVRHLVAVGSGKGGVGKSTLTLRLAAALRARGLRIGILDADLNGPSQARMAGVQGAVFVPGTHKAALPRTSNGIAVFSMGSLIPESESLEFEAAARGESHTWRATREFALLGEILGAFEWGTLDVLMVDLPPGAERTVQYADFLGPGLPTSFLLVTIPSEVARGVVARSVAALSKRTTRVVGYVENMSGYYCHDCRAIKPLFDSDRGAVPRRSLRASAFVPGAGARPRRSSKSAGGHSRGPHDGASEAPDLEIPCLGSVPFDPELARQCDLGNPQAMPGETPVARALEQIAERLLDELESTMSGRESHR
jgi:ATP-binding protein involved in chromosome partitioning